MKATERERYSRQTLFAPIGEAGQERLLASHAAVVGCGALGSFQAAALARAGVGRLTLVDRDYVEPSNLQRQWLYTEADAENATPKAVAARNALARINSGVRVDACVADLTPENVEELLGEADVLLDGSDNFEVRYLLNDFAVREGKPWIYGGAVASHGVMMPVVPGASACLACIFEEAPGGAQPTCDTAGVLGSTTAAVAAFQVAEALKILSGNQAAVRKQLLTLDVWEGVPRGISTAKPNADCRACGRREFPHLEPKARRAAVLCGRDAVQIHDRQGPLDLRQLAATLEPLGEIRANEYVVRFKAPPYEMTVFEDGRAIIKGAADAGVARSVYARYVGS